MSRENGTGSKAARATFHSKHGVRCFGACPTFPTDQSSCSFAKSGRELIGMLPVRAAVLISQRIATPPHESQSLCLLRIACQIPELPRVGLQIVKELKTGCCSKYRASTLCQRVLMFHHFRDEAGVGAICLVRSTDFNDRYEQSPDAMMSNT